MKWREVPWIGFDVETTGLDARKDRVLQFAAVVYDPVKAAFGAPLSLACGTDGVPIAEGARKVCGIDAGMVAGCEPFDAQLGHLCGFLSTQAPDDCIYLAYNAPFDCAFLHCAFDRQKFLMPFDPLRVLDPLVFARCFWSFNRLGELARRLQLVAEPAHEAVGDVRTMIRCWRELARKVRGLPDDFDELLKVQDAKIRQWELRSGKSYRRQLASVLEGDA